MPPIFKITSASAWRRAEDEGRFEGAPVDLADGFIHLSTAEQVAETAARHFAGESDLVLVTVDPGRLGEALRWEPSRGGALFPHLYGPLPIGAVIRAEPLPLGQDGRHLFPSLSVFDPRSEGWVPVRDGLFAGLVGPFWERPDDPSRYGVLAEQRHLNRNRLVHGGLLMSFIDQALGMTVWAASGKRRQVTVQLDTHFMEAGRAGDFMDARCHVVRQTRSLMFMSGEIAAGERLLLRANGIWKIFRPES